MSKTKQLVYEVDQSPFYRLSSKKNLLKLLQITQNKLDSLTQAQELYIERDDINEKSGKIRRIEAPKPHLKNVQKRLTELLARIKLPSYIHAPGRGRSYISNAKAHINAHVVRTLDIKNYFSSTPARRVYWFFHTRMQCSSDVAGILTKLSTFKEHLPTGSPVSPLLSYFSHIDMWETIYEIVKNNNCTLTVYMDDVTISGDCVSDKLIWQVEEQLRRHGLQSNKKKAKCYIGQSFCEITGVIVKRNGQLDIPNHQHQKIHEARQAFHSESDPKKRQKLGQNLQGLEAQAQQVKAANYSLTAV